MAGRSARVRMTSSERREQLISVARGLFAARGFDATSVEEIAAAADVSKPVVYEHFGGKEGLYAVVVDREVRTLIDAIRGALTTPEVGPRLLIEAAALALFDYVEASPDGFRILCRDAPVGSGIGSFGTILSDVAARVQDLLEAEFRARKLDPRTAGLYAQALVGMVAQTAQWWLDVRKPAKRVVVAHVVNLCWNGMGHMTAAPELRTPPGR